MNTWSLLVTNLLFFIKVTKKKRGQHFTATAVFTRERKHIKHAQTETHACMHTRTPTCNRIRRTITPTCTHKSHKPFHTHTQIHSAAVVSHLVIVAKHVSQEEPRLVFRAPRERLRLPVHLDSDLTAQLLRTRLDIDIYQREVEQQFHVRYQVFIYSTNTRYHTTVRQKKEKTCLVAVRSKNSSKLSCLCKLGTT